MLDQNISPGSDRGNPNNSNANANNNRSYFVTPRDERMPIYEATIPFARTNTLSIDDRYHFDSSSSSDSNSSSIVSSSIVKGAMPDTMRRTTSVHRYGTGIKHHHHHNNIANRNDSEQTKEEIEELRSMMPSLMVLEDTKYNVEGHRGVGPRRNNHGTRGRSRTRSGNSSSSKRCRTSMETIVQRARDRRSQLLGETAMGTLATFKDPFRQISAVRDGTNALVRSESEPNYHSKRMDPQTTPGAFEHTRGVSRSSGPAIDRAGHCFVPGNRSLLRQQLRGDRSFGVPLEPSPSRWKSIPPPPLWVAAAPHQSLRKQTHHHQHRAGRNPSQQPSFLRRQQQKQQVRVGHITNDKLFLPRNLPSRTSHSASSVPVITTLQPKRNPHTRYNNRSSITAAVATPRQRNHHLCTEDPLSASELAAASPTRQKEMIGERLYHKVHKTEPDRAGRITGILLDSDTCYELLNLLESPAEALRARIDAVLTVLREHQSSDS